MADATLVDLVKITALTTGTGAVTLGDAVPGYRGVEALLDGAVYGYSIQQEAEYEIGRCTYLQTSNQIVRTPEFTSNGGTPINLQANASIAFVATAEDILGRDVLRPLYGYGVPTNNIGLIGQVYTDLNVPVTLYGPKTAEGWGSGVILQGDAGAPGTAASYTSLPALRAADPTALFYALVTNIGLVNYGLQSGNFTGKVDDVNVVQLTAVPLTVGALVRQDTRSLSWTLPATLTPLLLDSKIARIAVDIDDFPRLPGETNYAGQTDRACRYCKATGTTLRLRPKYYPGARIEVHGTFNVEGNGARPDYLGYGTTIVGGSGQGFAAEQTPWAYDVSGYTVQMYAFTGATKGAATLTFATTPVFKAGDIIFMSGEPASNSSSGPNGDNYIPRYFEFQQVKAVSGQTVTLCSPLKEDYTNAKCRAFYTDGMAVNCHVRDLIITTTNDAYQYVVRSAYGGSITGIRFAGNAAVGASTFTGGGFRCSDWVVDGAYGGVSCARGTEDIIFSNIRWRTKSQDVNAQFIAIFIEESCYNVVVDGMKAVGGCFLVGSLNMSNPDGSAPATKRRIAVGGNSVFDTRMVANGSGTGPFQGGAAIGVDIYVDNTTLAGVPTTPDPNQAPGITGAALCWLSSNASYDTVTFGPGCIFISNGTVEAFKSGSAGGGQFLISEDATYIGAVVPQSRWTPRGIWADFSGQLASGVTPTAGEYSLPAVRRPWRGRDVHAEGLVNAPNLADNTALTQLPAFYRPKTTQLITLQGFGGADGYSTFPVITRLETNGIWTVVHRNGATVINLRASWPMDW